MTSQLPAVRTMFARPHVLTRNRCEMTADCIDVVMELAGHVSSTELPGSRPEHGSVLEVSGHPRDPPHEQRGELVSPLQQRGSLAPAGRSHGLRIARVAFAATIRDNAIRVASTQLSFRGSGPLPPPPGQSPD